VIFDQTAQLAFINGAAGTVWAPGGRPRVAFVFSIAHAKVVAIEMVADPKRIRQLVSIYEGTDLEDALATMRRSGAHLARSFTETGETTGVLFLEDIIEGHIGEEDPLVLEPRDVGEAPTRAQDTPRFTQRAGAPRDELEDERGEGGIEPAVIFTL